MKEIMCFIRANKVNDTKTALANGGFPAFTCRKCLGRGRKSISSDLFQALIREGDLPVNALGEAITESTRLIAKRFFTLIVQDDEVKKAADLIIEANQTGNPGDGKIFILPICEAYTIRSGEPTTEAY
ncbi:MAG: P-II family nitrogen regulator [Oscillospiraceae bacterium]|jgi:nitrogen regulatory protein PII 2|nr:P-II family nitrogen regulator [Oscillospiraceae bacterium]